MAAAALASEPSCDIPWLSSDGKKLGKRPVDKKARAEKAASG
jgi:hypothetical protein